MRVPLGWLCEYCDPGLGPEEIAELLSMRAVEVERVSRIGVPSGEGFVACGSARSTTAKACGRLSAAPRTSPRGSRSQWRCRERGCPAARS